MKLRQSLFWDVRPENIDLNKNSSYVIERVLEHGNDREVHWLSHAYSADFITTKRTFNTGTFIARLTEDGDWSTSSEEDGTVYGEYRGAKVSFIANPLFIPGSSAPAYGYITVLPPADIAVMKILAISRRGRKRDFFDLYWCVQNIEPLQNIVGRVPVQYPTASENMHHLLKGLVYFEDAEEDTKPEIYFKASWKDIKSFFIREVPHIAKRIVQ